MIISHKLIKWIKKLINIFKKDEKLIKQESILDILPQENITNEQDTYSNVTSLQAEFIDTKTSLKNNENISIYHDDLDVIEEEYKCTKIQENTITKQDDAYLHIPSLLVGFTNTETYFQNEKNILICNGDLELIEDDCKCEECGNTMYINAHKDISLKHIPFGSNKVSVKFKRTQLYCEKCKYTKMQDIAFKAEKHLITIELYNYARDLLATGHYTNTEIAEITGLNRNIVKEIDLKRLKEKYTIDGKKLIKPEKQATYLGIDEFKLHNGYKYATHIIDLETGHILWIQEGKKKQVVYDFIEHVGIDWMNNVNAVSCDMNSDFQEAFEEKCPHIRIVFDYFHIVKNFNEKVISEVRKDEQRRLEAEGNEDGAKALKKSRFILTSSRKTLQEKDDEAKEEKIIRNGSELFKTKTITRKFGYENRYDELLKENELLFIVDIIKEKISYAYSLNDELKMRDELNGIIEICQETNNKHLLWFKKLIENHIEGMVAHAIYNISSGKIEGINNKIKTLRRQAYGYPDNEYFFLKLFDISRTNKC